MSNAQYTNVNNIKRVKQTHDDKHNMKQDGSWFISWFIFYKLIYKLIYKNVTHDSWMDPRVFQTLEFQLNLKQDTVLLLAKTGDIISTLYIAIGVIFLDSYL